MQRILLPLAIVASIYFLPLFSVETSDVLRGAKTDEVTGRYFIGNAVDCVLSLRAPVGEACESEGELGGSHMTGHVMTWAAMISLAAAALGVLGLLPVVGRIVSVVTIIAGLATLGALGLLALTLIGSPVGLPGLAWGFYLTGGAGLLTLIAGLAGLRGR